MTGAQVPLSNSCKVCGAECRRKFCGSPCRNRDWNSRHPGRNNKARNRPAVMRKYRYGIDADLFDRLMSSQAGRCPICEREFDDARKSTKPHVDHNHETGQIRGLLCGNCNRGVGLLGDNTDNLKRAINYLEGVVSC